MLTAVIIDDERNAREFLEILLTENLPNVSIVGQAANAQEGYEVVLKTQPDMVFLDVEMPGGTGFDMLTKFSKIDFDVVFTTAYDHYAIKAIQFSAVGYILKPLSPSDLIETVTKIEDRRRIEDQNDKIQELLRNMAGQENKRIAIPDSKGVTFINVPDIVRLEASGSYTEVYLSGETKPMLASKSLREFEYLLSQHNFFRVHHSNIINLDRMKRYDKEDGGYIVMSDDSQVEISRRRKNDFIKMLK